MTSSTLFVQEKLTIAIVHDGTLGRIVENSLASGPVHFSVALQDVVAAALQAARPIRVGICSRDGRAPAHANFVLATRGRLIRVVPVRLSLAEEEVKVVLILVQEAGLSLVHPGGQVADLGRAAQVLDGLGVGAHGPDVDVVPVGPPVHVVRATDLDHCRIDCVEGTAGCGLDTGAAVIRPRAVPHAV